MLNILFTKTNLYRNKKLTLLYCNKVSFLFESLFYFCYILITAIDFILLLSLYYYYHFYDFKLAIIFKTFDFILYL